MYSVFSRTKWHCKTVKKTRLLPNRPENCYCENFKHSLTSICLPINEPLHEDNGVIVCLKVKHFKWWRNTNMVKQTPGRNSTQNIPSKGCIHAYDISRKWWKSEDCIQPTCTHNPFSQVQNAAGSLLPLESPTHWLEVSTRHHTAHTCTNLLHCKQALLPHNIIWLSLKFWYCPNTN